MLEYVATKTLDIAKRFWLIIAAVFAVSFVLTMLFSPSFVFIPAILLACFILGVYTGSVLHARRETHARYPGSNNTQHVPDIQQRYLAYIEETHQYIRSSMLQSQQGWESIALPLTNIYITPHITSDRFRNPISRTEVHEKRAAGEAQAYTRLEAVKASPSLLKLEEQHGGLSFPVSLEDEIQQLSVQQPLCVILGAPGSGKSTALRWLALLMAEKRPHKGGDPVSLPILAHISDYARYLESSNGPFHTFLNEHFFQLLPDFSTMLQQAIERGECLFLLDGLDEVNDEQQRNRITEEIYHFFRRSSRYTDKHFNRFVITSRIIGYKKNTFSDYRHYTLLDFTDEQIQEFLSRWCFAVESTLMMSVQDMNPLSREQEEQARKLSNEQRDQLVAALKASPAIRRLATNPLMLTILATIQRSGKVLPQRRIELYQIITRTFLNNWRGSNGRRLFVGEELSLARPLLSQLAYRLHNNGAVLAEREVQTVVKNTLADFYEITPERVRDQDITLFMETLRSSNGLFVESGQGLYSFMHRTFQEYYVAQYLLQQEPGELERITLQHYHDPAWHETLVLAIAEKSGRESRDDQAQVNDLLQEVLQKPGTYDYLLQRNLLFVAHCLVDCMQWPIRKDLQQQVADDLFTLYGDSAGPGRYTQLREEIDDVALLWLRAQPEMSKRSSTFSPLLEAWREALYTSKLATRQRGATHLFAMLAPHLADCADEVLFALIPPLLEQARLRDLPCPEEMKPYFDYAHSGYYIHPQHSKKSSAIELYAFIALRLLDTAGPPGWLRHNWLQWQQAQPKLLEQLASHSQEINYTLTPAALPIRAKETPRNGSRKDNSSSSYGTRFSRSSLPAKNLLHQLEESDTVRYPQAFLYWKMCRREADEPGPWQFSWHSFLQREMALGRAATYQASVSLRTLLNQHNDQQLQALADELVHNLAGEGMVQQQALHTITSLYLYKSYHMRQHLTFDQVGVLQQTLDLRVLRTLFDGIKPELPRYTRDWLDSVMMLYLLNILDLLEPNGTGEEPAQHKLLPLLNRTQITATLCNLIERKGEDAPEAAFVCLYSMLASTDMLPAAQQGQIERLMKHVAETTSSAEKYLLVSAVLKEHVKNDVYDPHFSRSPSYISGRATENTGASGTRWTQLRTISQQIQLTRSQVETILALCRETGGSFEDLLRGGDESHEQYQLAKLLTRHFVPDSEALTALFEAVGSNDSTVSRAAILLLQHSELPSQEAKKSAVKHIARLLAPQERGRRHAQGLHAWPLEDALFATLEALVE